MLMDIHAERDSEHWNIKHIKSQQKITNLFDCFQI